MALVGVPIGGDQIRVAVELPGVERMFDGAPTVAVPDRGVAWCTIEPCVRADADA